MFELLNAVSAELIRTVTGRLFTDAQIRSVAGHAVGKYFADLLPEQADDRSARERVEEARTHIAKATEIIGQLQSELSTQTRQLDQVLSEIEEKKVLAQRYEVLAKTGKDQFAALKTEMEAALRQELVTQSERGKATRRIASFLLWLLTLILGAALGTYFKEIIAWGAKVAA